MDLRRQRVPEKNNQIYLIVLNLRTYLLLSAQMTGKIFVYGKIGYFLNQSSRCAMQKFCISFFFASCAISAMFILITLSYFVSPYCRLHCSLTFNTNPIPIYKLTKEVSP